MCVFLFCFSLFVRAMVNSQAYKQHLQWVMIVLFKLEVVGAVWNDSKCIDLCFWQLTV